MKVYQKDGRLFALTASGCSCNDFDDYWDSPEAAISDMTELATLDEAHRFYDGWRYGYDAKWFDVVEQFRELGLR